MSTLPSSDIGDVVSGEQRIGMVIIISGVVLVIIVLPCLQRSRTVTSSVWHLGVCYDEKESMQTQSVYAQRLREALFAVA